MKELAAWIYQEKKCEVPWAMKVTARKQRYKISADIEIYAEYFPSKSKRMIIRDVNISKASQQAMSDIDAVMTMCGHPLDEQDKRQIFKEINELKEQFID